METEKEINKLLGENSEFEKLLEEKGKDGWEYAGIESLTETKFHSDTGLFKEVPVQDEQSIIDKYLKNGYEAELVAKGNNILIFIKKK